MEDNKDLLDLCRLNLLDENIIVDPEDQEIITTKKAIAWKKRRLAEKIRNNAPKVCQPKQKEAKLFIDYRSMDDDLE